MVFSSNLKSAADNYIWSKHLKVDELYYLNAPLNQ